MVPQKPNLHVHPRVASRRRAIFKTNQALRKVHFFKDLLEQVVFLDLFSEAYFWLEKC